MQKKFLVLVCYLRNLKRKIFRSINLLFLKGVIKNKCNINQNWILYHLDMSRDPNNLKGKESLECPLCVWMSKLSFGRFGWLVDNPLWDFSNAARQVGCCPNKERQIGNYRSILKAGPKICTLWRRQTKKCIPNNMNWLLRKSNLK